MRVFVLLLPLVASCEAEPTAPDSVVAGTFAPCALGGAETFDARCQVVRGVADGRTLLTLIAPDGGFRRIEVAADGSGIRAADGAIPARTRPDGAGGIEVAIAGDRYRLPAAT